MPDYSESTTQLVEELSELLIDKSWTIATAESCTGGMIAAALTEIAGSSAWFHQGVVSYANHAKTALLDVDETTLQQYGAVSEQVVEEMAVGICRKAAANVAIAVSGVAGPGGGSIDKPVGTVWIAWALGPGNVQSACFLFDGDRSNVRAGALTEALRGIIRRVRSA